MAVNVIKLGHMPSSSLMAPAITDPQVMYTLRIPGGTLQDRNSLRITMQISAANLAAIVPNLNVQAQEYFVSDAGNFRTSWSYISEDEEVYVLVSKEGALYGGNDVWVNHFLGPGFKEQVGKLGIAGDPSETAVMPRSGQSDEPAYAWFGGVGGGDSKFHIRFPNSGAGWSSNITDDPYVPFTGNLGGPWAKRGDSVYVVAATTFGVTGFHRFAAASGNVLQSNSLLNSVGCSSITVTDNFVYALVGANGGEIWKFAVDNIDVVVDIIPLHGLSATAIVAVSDSKIYVLSSSAPLTSESVVYYWDAIAGKVRYVGFTTPQINISFFSWGNFPALFFRGASEGVIITEAGAACEIISPSGPYLYAGGNGMAGFAQNIYRFDLQGLPITDPVISFDPITIAAGGDIEVTWEDIYNPTSGDFFAMFAVGSEFDTNGISGTKNFLGTRASGSMTFTVPISTTPGTYVLRMGYNNRRIQLAQSVVLTVT